MKKWKVFLLKINVKYFLIPFISVYVHERKCAYECVYL